MGCAWKASSRGSGGSHLWTRSRGTDEGWGVEKIEKSAGVRRVQSLHQPSPVRNRILEQEHQFEGSDFTHRTQYLEQFGFASLRKPGRTTREDDNDLGEHRRSDS